MISKAKVITNNKKEEVFKEIVDNYKLMVVNTCYGFVHNLEDADDIAQDVFVDVWRKLDTFKGQSKMSTWIYRIAVNKSLNFLRQNKSNPIICALESIKENIFNQTSKDNDDDLEERSKKIKLIHKAIKRLPEKQKTTFVLFYYEGLVYKEIADITGSSIASVESVLFRARNNVKKYLKDPNLIYEE